MTLVIREFSLGQVYCARTQDKKKKNKQIQKPKEKKYGCPFETNPVRLRVRPTGNAREERGRGVATW